MPHAVLVVLVPLLAAIPPLSPDQTDRLHAVREDRDSHGEALNALLEHVTTWPAGAGDAVIGETPVRLRVDYDELLADPDARRGALYRVTGRLQQRDALDAPFDHAEEWFLRDDAGRALAVFLPGGTEVEPGAQVTIPARFYKRLQYVARDGAMRRCPAFVGASPAVERAAPAAFPFVAMVAVVAGMLLVFAVLLVVARRGRRPLPRVRGAIDPDEVVEATAPLPDDPAEALRVLERRAAGTDDD